MMNDEVVRLHFPVCWWEVAGFLFGPMWIASLAVLVISSVQYLTIQDVSVPYVWAWLGMFAVSSVFWFYIFRTGDK